MIHISYDRRKYQEDMINNIRTFDNVVEIGCHIGTSTKIISRLNQDGIVYAFDNSPESIEAMSNLGIEYANIHFFNADVRNEEILYLDSFYSNLFLKNSKTNYIYNKEY